MTHRLKMIGLTILALLVLTIISAIIDNMYITLERGRCLIHDSIEFGSCSDIVSIVEIGKKKVLLIQNGVEREESKISVRENYDYVDCECSERPVRK